LLWVGLKVVFCKLNVLRHDAELDEGPLKLPLLSARETQPVRADLADQERVACQGCCLPGAHSLLAKFEEQVF